MTALRRDGPSAEPEPGAPGTVEAPIASLAARPSLTLPRWLAPLAVCAVVAMVPWMVYLAMTLPARFRTEHYDVAWIGFDAAMWLVLAALALAAFRRHPATGPVAAIAAAMFVMDAWFDVTTSHGDGFLVSVLLAVLVELPMALVCAWTAINAERVRERAYRTLYERWRRAEQELSEVRSAASEVSRQAGPR